MKQNNQNNQNNQTKQNKQNKKYKQFIRLTLNKNDNFTLEYKHYHYIDYKYGCVFYTKNKYNYHKYGNNEDAYNNQKWEYLSKNIVEELPDKIETFLWIENSIIWDIIKKLNIYII